MVREYDILGLIDGCIIIRLLHHRVTLCKSMFTLVYIFQQFKLFDINYCLFLTICYSQCS